MVIWEYKIYAFHLFVEMSTLYVCESNRAEREVVLSNLDTLCSVALGEKVTEDFLLARDTVITICSITDHVRVRRHKPWFASSHAALLLPNPN